MAMYSFYAVPLYLIALMVLFYTSHENAVMCVVSGAQQRYESWGGRMAEGHESSGRRPRWGGAWGGGVPLPTGGGVWGVGCDPPLPPPRKFCKFLSCNGAFRHILTDIFCFIGLLRRQNTPPTSLSCRDNRITYSQFAQFLTKKYKISLTV